MFLPYWGSIRHEWIYLVVIERRKAWWFLPKKKRGIFQPLHWRFDDPRDWICIPVGFWKGSVSPKDRSYRSFTNQPAINKKSYECWHVRAIELSPFQVVNHHLVRCQVVRKFQGRIRENEQSCGTFLPGYWMLPRTCACMYMLHLHIGLRQIRDNYFILFLDAWA